MTELTDAFVALPGGIGTLDELFEAWTWNALGFHAKPFALLNVNGFWDGLDEFMDKVVAAGFLSSARREQLLMAHSPKRRSNCWTRPSRARHKAWSGKRLISPGEGRFHELNSARHGRDRRDPRARLPCSPPTAGRSACAWSARPSRCRRGSPCWCSTRRGGAPAIQALSFGVANLLGYATKGTEFLFGPSASNPLANTFAIAALPVIIFFATPCRDPLLPRHHAADRPLGRRGDRLGHRDQPGRKPERRGQHLRRPERIAAGHPALSRRADPGAIVHRDDGRHGRRRGDDPRRLCRAARVATICPICSRRRSCRRRAAS